jgi:hypothetical protein
LETMWLMAVVIDDDVVCGLLDWKVARGERRESGVGVSGMP